MEISKMTTLRLMMDQEKKNLENLRSSSNNSNRNSNDISRAEANITKLGEQLRQMCGEVSNSQKCPSSCIVFIHQSNRKKNEHNKIPSSQKLTMRLKENTIRIIRTEKLKIFFFSLFI